MNTSINTSNTYEVGDLVRLTAAFKDAGGTLTDPTTITLKVKAGGVTITYSDAVKDSVGNYYKDVPILLSGQCDYTWTGAGAVQTAAQGRFTVRSVFA